MPQRKWFQLVDGGRKPMSPIAFVCVDGEAVYSFLHAAKMKFKSELDEVEYLALTVIARGRRLLSSASLEGLGDHEFDALIVKMPQLTRGDFFEALGLGKMQDVFWFGVDKIGTLQKMQSTNLTDERTLSRTALTTDIIRRLDKKRALLISGPSNTGKTSLAVLVSRDLVKRADRQKQKVAVATFTMSSVGTMADAFRSQCGRSWSSAMALSNEGCTVYIVMDQAQLLYEDPTAFSTRKADYGFEHGSPIQMPSDMVIGIDRLNFSLQEVKEYVSKQFHGFECLEHGALGPFCAHLLWLTGGNVGLCQSALFALGKVYVTRMRKGIAPPSTQEWLRMLESGSLYEDNDHALFDAMKARGVYRSLISLLTIKEEEDLYRIVCGIATESDADSLSMCLRYGILNRIGSEFDFSSPVIWRDFVLSTVTYIDRALQVPKSLRQMMESVIQNINYDTIRQALDKNSPSSKSVERAWQLEYYQALYRCTPNHFVTSADVGALFGTKDFIDFTIRIGNEHGGIDLLRQGESWKEHLKRFAPDGRYSLLELSDFCLLEFRHVASVEKVMKDEAVTADDGKRIVMCYDESLKHVAALNSHFGLFSKSLLLLFLE